MSLAIQHIEKSYRNQQVLTDIQIDFQPETLYGLLGRNGAGKSTLLNVINSRIFADKGSITLDGENLIENEALQNRVFLTSEDNLYPKSIKVNQVLKLTEAFYGGFDWVFANHLIKAFKLNPKLSFKKLSTGYRSILKLIIALCVPVDYIFLDEPILGLDASHRDLFYRALIETYSERPRTFVISTHLIEEVANLISEFIIIDGGRVIEQKSAEDIQQSGATVSRAKELVEDFIQGMNIIGMDRLGSLVSYYIKDYQQQEVPDGISISPLNLQAYFVKLTQREEEK